MTAVGERMLLRTATISVRDIVCDGACRQKSPFECATAVAIVFPYRGLFVRHLGKDDAVGEANQALFFNPYQDYCISHPVAGGDACLSLSIEDETLREIVPKTRLISGEQIEFRYQRLRLIPADHAQVVRLRHRLRADIVDMLEAEILALELIGSVLRDGQPPSSLPGSGRQKLVDRAKIVLAADPARSWSLADIGRQVGCSPVYLTQLFRQVEGVPLYRYQMRLRLARAADLLPERDDLTALALELGFSSHSHFSAVFKTMYGQSPSSLRAELRGRNS